jgi:Contractile injection system tape measure protein
LVKTKAFFTSRILPVISNRADCISGHLYIDKLEIDIGTVTEADLQSRFEQVFEKAWQEKLAALHIPEKETAAVAGKQQSTTNINKAAIAEDKRMSNADILHFLNRGYWPWYFQSATPEQLASFLTDFFRNTERLLQLIHSLAGERRAAERLVYLVAGQAALKGFLLAALPVYHPVLHNYTFFTQPAAVWKKPETTPFYNRLLRRLLINSVLDTAHDWHSLLQELIRSEQQLTGVKEETSPLLLPARQRNKLLPEKALLHLFEELDKNNRKALSKKTSSALTEDTPEKTVWAYQAGQTQNAIAISNAGLLLLHPYLFYVFKELGWLNAQKQFLNKSVQQKAVLFLQHVINKKSRQAEQELILNKVLCGWPLEQPLQLKCNFSAKEKAAATDLLLSLKEHWTVLKNTSLPGLISSFILRKGILQPVADGYLLKVEQKTIDILLESLPFGIQTIKMPWNEYIIHTEWTA